MSHRIVVLSMITLACAACVGNPYDTGLVAARDQPVSWQRVSPAPSPSPVASPTPEAPLVIPSLPVTRTVIGSPPAGTASPTP